MDLSARNITKVLSVVTVFLLFLLFLNNIRTVLGWIAAAFLIAVLINPFVGWIQRFIPKKNRITAILLTVAFITILIGFFVFVMLQPLIQSFGGIIDEITKAINSAKGNDTVKGLISQINWKDASSKQVFTTVGGGITGIALGIVNGIFAFVTILSLSIFMLINPKNVVDSVGKYIPKKHRSLYQKINNNLSNIVPKYFGGLLMVATIAGITSFIALLILQIPFAPALALSVFFLDMIPMVGATLGAALVVGFCFLIGQPVAAIIFVIYYILYQLVENNIITPLIQQKTVKLSPLSILIAILIGSAAAGMVGALLAIPVAALIKLTYQDLKDEGYINPS
ncbi:MAG: AI-2E family transporter [bacterium]